MDFLKDESKEILNDFVKFVKNNLGIKSMPTIKIQNNRDGLKTTANYDYTKENKIVRVCAKNRALVDVMRSIAHELVHHKQWEDGKLETRPADIGSPEEDEANALAGRYIKMYALKNSSIYDK